MNKIGKINLELSILDDKLQIYGRTKCKDYKKGSCYFFSNAGRSFFIPTKCNLFDCPLVDNGK